MTADNPEVANGESDGDGNKPTSGDTVSMGAKKSRQAEGYSVRPRPASTEKDNDKARSKTEVHATPSGLKEDIKCEDDCLVLLPSEVVGEAAQLQQPGVDGLSWQTEALDPAASGADTEQFTSAHDDVGFLPSEEIPHADEVVQASAGSGLGGELSWQTEALDATASGAATEQFTDAHDNVGFLPSEELTGSALPEADGQLSWQTEALEAAQSAADTEQFSGAHDNVVIVPSEEIAASIPESESVLAGGGGLSWQTEALDASAPGAATEQYGSGELGSGDGVYATEEMGYQGGHDDVPLLTTHPDFAGEATQEMDMADLPELEDVEDITALVDDDEVIQLEAPEDSYEIDFDELQANFDERSSKMPMILATLATAAAVAVAAIFFLPEKPEPIGSGSGTEVAVIDRDPEPVDPAAVDPNAEPVATGSDVDVVDEGAIGEGETVELTVVEPDPTVAGEDPMTDPTTEPMTGDSGVESGMQVVGPRALTADPGTLEGWLQSSLDRHFDMNTNVQD